MTTHKPVPVEAAKEIADKYEKSIVIIFTHDPVSGLLHTTTYGTDPQNKAWAAAGGEIGTKALGGLREASTDFEDYRLTQAKSLYLALRGIMKEIEIGSLVRKTADDNAPGWGVRQIPLVLALKKADSALKEAAEFIG